MFCIAVQCIELQSIALHSNTLHYIELHLFELHCRKLAQSSHRANQEADGSPGQADRGERGRDYKEDVGEAGCRPAERKCGSPSE